MDSKDEFIEMFGTAQEEDQQQSKNVSTPKRHQLLRGKDVLLEACDHQTIPDFVKTVIENLCSFKTDLVRDEIFIRIDKEKFIHYGCGSFWDDKLAEWCTVEDAGILDILKSIIIQQIKPRINSEDATRCLNITIKALSKSNSENIVVDYFEKTCEDISEQEAQRAYDDFISSIEFYDNKNHAAYKNIFEIFMTGMVFNMLMVDINRKVENANYHFPFFSDKDLQRIKNRLGGPLTPFNGLIILCGEVQVGKSHFWNSFLPKELRNNVAIGSDLIPRTSVIKDHLMAIRLRGTLILNLEDENDSFFKQLSTYVKKPLERTEWTFRVLYEKNEKTINRRFTPVVTTNILNMIHDETSNRRILPLHIKYINREKINSVDRNLLWANAYHKFKYKQEHILDWYACEGNRKDFGSICINHGALEPVSFISRLEETLQHYSLKDKESEERLIEICSQVLTFSNSFFEALCIMIRHIQVDFCFISYEMAFTCFNAKGRPENVLTKSCEQLSFTLFEHSYKQNKRKRKKKHKLFIAYKTHGLQQLVKKYLKSQFENFTSLSNFDPEESVVTAIQDRLLNGFQIDINVAPRQQVREIGETYLAQEGDTRNKAKVIEEEEAPF